MKKNISVLIITSILGLIALSIIQGYLINNTYKLKKETFIREVKQSIVKFDNNLIVFDTIYDNIRENLVSKISNYKLGILKKSDFLNDLDLVDDGINSIYIKASKEEFKKRNIEYTLKHQRRLKSIVILDDSDNDTLYFEPQIAKSQLLLGEAFVPESDYKINPDKVSTNYSTDYLDVNGEWQSLNFDFEFTTENYLNIDGWKRIVLGRMTGTLVLSILIFILVIGLLSYSIKNLITQKKIADIKTDFVNNITHEFKTPLATLSLATKMLKNDVFKSQPETIIETIDRQNIRLQKLIDQVINNSLASHNVTLNLASVDTSNYINTILDDFLLSTDHKVKLQRDIQSNNIIQIDKFYFTTAILNILENAVKYCQNKPIIQCQLTSNQTHFSLTISDNGIGISEQHQSHIFDKFFRIDQNQTHDVKGLGLGLFYTYKIIKAHQGVIDINSKIGKGSTFIIRVPLKQAIENE